MCPTPLLVTWSVFFIMKKRRKQQTVLSWGNNKCECMPVCVCVRERERRRERERGRERERERDSTHMLKHSTHKLREATLKLFNLILSSGHFPEQWKVSHITPIHKKGDKL